MFSWPMYTERTAKRGRCGTQPKERQTWTQVPR